MLSTWPLYALCLVYFARVSVLYSMSSQSHDPTQQWNEFPQPDMDKNMSKQQFRDMAQLFLHDISFETLPGTVYDLSIEEVVIEFFQIQGFSSTFIKHLKPTIETSAWLAKSTYGFTSTKIQEVIAIYTALLTEIEDTSKEYLPDLKAFLSRLLLNQPQGNQVLETLVNFIPVVRGLYGPFAFNMIMKSTIEYVSMCAVEQEHLGEIHLSPSSPELPTYIRTRVSAGELYTFFAFPEALLPERNFLHQYLPAVPSIIQYLNLANDFLSFYKESIVSTERSNYVYNHSQTFSIPLGQCLEDIKSLIVGYFCKVHETLAVLPEIQSCIKNLFYGYVMFHCGASRYRLWELDIPQVNEVRKAIRYPL